MSETKIFNSIIASNGCSLLTMLILSFSVFSWVRPEVTAQQVPAQQAPATVKSRTRIGVSSEQPAGGTFVKIEGGFMVPYKTTIPGTDTEFEMVPVPGGTFTMGSPANEDGRLADEGPQFNVVVKPFWIGKYEVTWDEYRRFMDLTDVFQKLNRRKIRAKLKEFSVDTISSPSQLYKPDFTYAAGDEYNQPAATVSQYGAKQYTKWLSLTSSDFYRLPYEAEWEYACRAGTKTAYSFGDDVDDLGDYAWFVENSDEERHVVGEKEKNAFGLFDMHGNVAEWVLDAYNEKGYTHLKAGKTYTVEQTYNKPTEIYSRVVRGGSWELDDVQCRSAARLGSEAEWKNSDPQEPRSPYWFTDTPSLGVGFRLIRPLEAPATLAAKNEFWKTDNEDVVSNLVDRADHGLGALGTADEKLPAEMAKVLEE